MSSIWFIRHAESQGNVGLKTASPSVTALTPRGHAQARYIPSGFERPPSLLVTSSYVRTKQTAAPTVSQFGTIRQEEWPVHEITFLEPSRFLNSSREERRPAFQAYWDRCDPYYVDGENAESFCDFIARVDTTLERVREQGEDFTAIFSHGFVIRGALWRLLNPDTPVNRESMQRFRMFFMSVEVPNASIFKIRFLESGEVQFSNFILTHLPRHLRDSVK